MKRTLPAIVISQFFCTSLWFAGNAIMGDIVKQFHLAPNFLGYLTNAVQSGFIAGTLIFAILNIADRFSPVLVFLFSAIIASVFNLAIGFNGISLSALMMLRFMTGFFLAGIYPVGMKIASDHYKQGLGKSLGFLVGALVIGTSFPHLLKSLMAMLPWKYVIFSTSLLSLLGGLAMFLLVPDGPYRKPAQKLKLNAFLQNFGHKDFRAAALGYFGHMWELYAFWVFVPVMLAAYKSAQHVDLNVPLISFLVIVSGSIACVFSGFISQRLGVKKTATIALFISCTCCIVSPLFLLCNSVIALIIFLFIWGMAVIADSPMFSTLVAQNASEATRGTALTIVNCIGFFITIISIQLINAIRTDENAGYIYIMLAIGPILGLFALIRNKSIVNTKSLTSKA